MSGLKAAMKGERRMVFAILGGGVLVALLLAFIGKRSMRRQAAATEALEAQAGAPTIETNEAEALADEAGATAGGEDA